MIRRTLAAKLRALARTFPTVTVTGPRQSGKTTLCRATFPGKAYVSLEAPDVREYALRDPRGLIAEHVGGAIFDEVQRAPELLSYLQGEVDERPTAGRFILTGSANFALLQSVSQSLAGRTGLLQLLPLSLEEVRRFPERPEELFTLLWQGAYPALYDRGVPPGDWFAAYVGTYVERDVRQILNVTDLATFQTFLRLCAGRSAQLLNASALGADAGVTHNTARAWLAVIEASYLALRLPPFHANIRKRLVKAPKLHFYDSGLLCYLLGITRPEQLREHPLRGAIFESWVVSEIVKARANLGLAPNLSFYRDRKGLEVDAVLDRGTELVAVETKSGQTVANDFFDALHAFVDVLTSRKRAPRVTSLVVYGGTQRQRRADATVIPWSKLDDFDWS
ncbi:MAG: AAA family ATPase [Acidobacteria bacterium RBG_16_68_9]|nr:MAG: AAA family ATPase [Acidobacteria bacterium RBG_16_68_9]